MNQQNTAQIAFVRVQHVHVPALVFHALVHVQVEVPVKMSFFRKKKIPSGRYTYRGKDQYAGMSLQLRVEPNRQGVMVINANTVLHLNQTASAFAYFFMQGLPQKEVLSQIRRMYHVNAETAKTDYTKLVYTISTLAKTEKVDPVSFLEIEKEEPFSYQYSCLLYTSPSPRDS